MPQPQKASSMLTLIQNKPGAASKAVYPETLVSHGPAHRVCIATKPP